MTVSEFLMQLAGNLDLAAARPADFPFSLKEWAAQCRDYATIAMNEYELEPAPPKRVVLKRKTAR